MIQKESANVIRDENGNPLAILLRIASKWIWCSVKELDEQGNIELIEDLINEKE